MSQRRSNIRTWILLVLALLPTTAMLIAGVWLWSATGDDLTGAQRASAPLETSVELFRSASVVIRSDAALNAAATADATPELREIAERELELANEVITASPGRISELFEQLSDTTQESSDGSVVEVIGEQFGFAAGVLRQQTVGAPPTQAMSFLSAMAIQNGVGLVLPTETSSRDAAFLLEATTASIEYHEQYVTDRAAVLDAFLAGNDPADLEMIWASPALDDRWGDLIDSRTFSVGGIGDIEWQSTTTDPENPVFLLRDEPLATIVANADLTTPDGRNAFLVDLLSVDEALRNDAELAYAAAAESFADEVIAIQRDRLLTAIGSVIVMLVGLMLLGLTLSEVRARQRVERAHGEAIDQLADKADRDPTTGAWNRRRLERTLATRLSNADRDGERVVLAYIDLDSFKAINDVWGHNTGDLVLRIVTQRLDNLAFENRSFELIRFGGDEFVVYATVDGADLDWLERFGSAILAVLAQPMSVGGREHSVSASIGITMSDPDSTLDSMLLEADSSLIHAKRAKRGTAIVYNRKVSRTGELVHALPGALSQGEITCHLQPVFDTRTGRITHAEALARWFRPNGESVSPGLFVPLIESFGLAEQLTSSILTSVGSILADPTTPQHVRVWINLSPRELEIANFALRFAEAIKIAKVAPHRIGLEITETAAVRDPAALGEELRQIREIGVQVAIDDFGNGYSPLGYLRELPLDVVKIDRSLISDIDTDVASQHIVRGVVGMVHELGMRITAEGVERTEEEAWLAAHGVHTTQGFLRGRPVAPDRLDWHATFESGFDADSSAAAAPPTAPTSGTADGSNVALGALRA